MTDKLPPDWAVKKACKSAGYDELHYSHAIGRPDQNPTIIAFARYISEHEKAPTDPLLIEARALVNGINDVILTYDPPLGLLSASEVECGRQDDHYSVVLAMRALRRGIELGKSS